MKNVGWLIYIVVMLLLLITDSRQSNMIKSALPQGRAAIQKETQGSMKAKQEALYMALDRVDLDTARALLDSGVDVNAAILHRAAWVGDPGIVDSIIRQSSSIDDLKPNDALITAAGFAKTDVVRLLLAAGADVDATDDYGTTPLMAAADSAGEHYDETIKVLVYSGAKVNERDGRGRNALMYAVQSGRCGYCHKSLATMPKAIKILVGAGADVNAQDEDGMTALMIAADSGLPEAVESLLDAGANAKRRDKQGRTALTHAKRGKPDRLIREQASYDEAVLKSWRVRVVRLLTVADSGTNSRACGLRNSALRQTEVGFPWKTQGSPMKELVRWRQRWNQV